MQVEGTIRNTSYRPVHRLLMEVVPPGCIQNIWNLHEHRPGSVYELMEYWRAKGGMQPGETLTWGGIFTTGDLKFIFRDPCSG